MEISKSFSKWVYEDGLAATEDPSHPCRPMVDWQTANGFTPFQLPEPYGGSKSDLNLAFIGLNPSISQSTTIPKATGEWSFEKYDKFYRDRIDNGPRRKDGKLTENVWLWNRIEDFGNSYLSDLIQGEFQLGANATLIEVVRYKSTKGWLGNPGQEENAVLEHQYKFTQALLEDSGCNIVVPMGNDAIRQLSQFLKFSKPMPSKIREAMGNLYSAETSLGKHLYICPIQHMSYSAGRDRQEEVATQILTAYEKILGDQSQVAA